MYEHDHDAFFVPWAFEGEKHADLLYKNKLLYR
jgi:hypothetical protein